jgi:hypothetical protein
MPQVNRMPEASTPLPTPPSTPLTLRSRLGPVFWLVLVGAILGILFGILEIGVNVDVLLNLSNSSTSRQITKLGLAYIAGGMGTIVFSIIGLIAGFGITEEKVPSALLMILAGVGISTAYFWGFWASIFPAMFFFIGGALLYLKKG